jgi:hypothetical protein
MKNRQTRRNFYTRGSELFFLRRGNSDTGRVPATRSSIARRRQSLWGGIAFLLVIVNAVTGDAPIRAMQGSAIHASDPIAASLRQRRHSFPAFAHRGVAPYNRSKVQAMHVLYQGKAPLPDANDASNRAGLRIRYSLDATPSDMQSKIRKLPRVCGSCTINATSLASPKPKIQVQRATSSIEYTSTSTRRYVE